MKTVYITTMMIAAFLMLTLPLSAKNRLENLPVSALPMTENGQSDILDDPVKIKITAKNEVVSIALEDYIFGVVAAEMPALYETEALKAQAVAAYTFYLTRLDPTNSQDFDITDDYTTDQAFITVESAREKWGDGADAYEEKIRGAVRSVLGKRVLYNGELARTVYHAISFGVTENAVDVWGGEYPYLVSVDSSFDKLSQDYIEEKTFTAENFKTLLSSIAEVKDLDKNCVSDIIKTTAGGVKSLKISGKEVTGADFRKALSLRSSCFELTFNLGKYTIKTQGYGHSVGMSQNGANYLAQQGKTYEEILLHYYTDCTVE